MEDLLRMPVTLALVTLNMVMSIRAFKDRVFFEKHVFWIGPIRSRGEWNRFVMSAFLHVNGPHLIINMYVLYEFGRILERSLGSPEFLLLYLVSLLAGNAWEYRANFNNPNFRAAGASGATSGIIMSFCLFYPFSTLLLFFVIPMWAIVLAVLFIIGSYFLSQREGSIIAHGAHLGGGLAGIAITLILRPEVWGDLVSQISTAFG